MRIAVWHNLPFGGAKRALFDHVRGLAERGWEMEFFSPPRPPDPFLPLERYGRVHEVPLDFEDRRPAGYLAGLVHHARRMDRLIPAMRAHAAECGRRIEAGGFDLLFANTDEIFHTPHIGRYVTSIPKVTFLQDPFRALYEPMPKLPVVPPPPGASPKAVVRDRVDLRTARRQSREELDNALAAGQILVNSYFSREATLRAFGLDSRVCYLGVDTDTFCPLNLPRERFVMGVGTFGPGKNPRLVVEAIARMPAPRPPLLWTCNMTDPVYRAEVVALAEKSNVDLRILEMTPDEEVVRLLNTAGAMAYAPRLEPFGFVPLEANACGLPVVAVAEGGVRETMADGETGYLVDSDPDSVASGLSRLLDDPAERARLGGTARARAVERWSLPAAQERLARELTRAVASA